MAPPTALLADMSQRGQYVCRSCLGSLRPTRPLWATTSPAARPPAVTTTTIPIRTLSRSATPVRGRSRRGGGTFRARSNNNTEEKLPTVEELRRGLEADTEADKLGRTDDEVSVRFFDQLMDGTIVPVSDPRSVESEIARKMSELEGKLKDSERLLQEIEEKKKKSSPGSGSGSPIKRRADRMRRRLEMIRDVEAEGRRLALEEVDAGDAEAAAQAASVRVSEMGLPAPMRKHVKNLNGVLRPAAARLRKTGDKGIDTRTITAVWSRYAAARVGLTRAWANVPAAAWAVLWAVLAREDGGVGGVFANPRRMSHIFYLTKDMQAAGVRLTDAQQLLAMEAMFMQGWQSEALGNWRRAAAALGAQPATALAYWELGVRMNAIHGDLERAQRAADHLFDGGLERDGCAQTKPNPRVLLQLIRNAAAHDAVDMAWDTYRRMHGVLAQEAEEGSSPGMTIEDYDEVVSAFLTANHTEHAFDVFVDMMFSGALDARQRLYVRQKHEQRYDKTKTKTNSNNSNNKAQGPALPPPVANAFFFGKWLKRLIGAGDLDGAHRVLQFMQSRGVSTAAVQVNGLLGAWLRSGTAANQALADALAWRMIRSRQVFVNLRRREKQMSWPLQLEARHSRNDDPVVVGGDKSSDDDLRYVPRASLETFLLMADNYKNRGQIAMLERLWTAFRDCELASTDAYMMNQLLESYTRDGRIAEARALYQHMVHGPQKVLPNANTFITLVRALAVNRGVAATMSDDERRAGGDECRRLVAEMTRVAPAAFGNSSGKARPFVDPREAAYYQALGRALLHTFRKTGDYVALHVMLQAMVRLMSTADAFRVPRFRMTTGLAIELVAGLSSTDSKYYQRDTPETRHRIFKASEVVETLLKDARMGQLALYGQAPRTRRVGGGPGTGAGPGAGAEEADDGELALSDDLSTAVAFVYRGRCQGVSDTLFAKLHDEAVAQMGLQAYVYY